MVRIKEDEFGLIYKKIGPPLPQGNIIAVNGEVGWQADILGPGVHLKYASPIYRIEKKKIIHIDIDEIGLVKAKDGEIPPPSRIFGKVVDCNNFQDGKSFLEHGGERGKQLAIILPGYYRINTELFDIIKGSVTRIHANQIGLVTSSEGKIPPIGCDFGKFVECENYQDAKAFIAGGGERGKQPAILVHGEYRINTDVFRIQRVPITEIEKDKVGIVRAKDGKPRPNGKNFAKVVECDYFQNAQSFFDNGGQAGTQLPVLVPASYYINTLLFEVEQVPIINIPHGEIAVVVAKDGAPLSSERALGRSVECNDFQDVEAFLKNSGQRGEQLSILKPGQYQINTEFFTVITRENASNYDISSEDLKERKIKSGHIGIVETREGVPLPQNEIAAPVIQGHNKFQDPQKFLDLGGYKGLQEEILPEGGWNINPRFATVEEVPLTTVENGAVGVVISDVGKMPDDNTTIIVSPGFKGIWDIPYRAGQHPINTRAQKVVFVPIHDIALDWTDRKEKAADNYDANLNSLTLDSSDGFEFKLEVTQVIRIEPENAPYMISRIVSEGDEVLDVGDSSEVRNSKTYKYGSIQNLVTRVLEPMVSSFFRSAAYKFTAVEFLKERDSILLDAATHIQEALAKYKVTAVNTLIEDIVLPEKLTGELQEQTLEELRRDTIRQKQQTQEENSNLVDIEEDIRNKPALIKAQTEARIQELNAQAQAFEMRAIQGVELERIEQEQKLELIKAEAEQKMEILKAEAEQRLELVILQTKLRELGPELYTHMVSEGLWAEALPKIKMDVPQIFMNGGSGSNTGGLEAMQLMNVQLIQSVQEFLEKKQLSRQKDFPRFDESPIKGSIEASDS